MGDFFRRYLLPGFVFEAAVIGGGYATGRELVEFFLPAGPLGGLLGMAVSMLVWSAVLAVSFELARRARTYDYRSFLKLLLGRGWFLFEIAYLLLIVLILAVMGAAAGEIVHNLFGLPKLAGLAAHDRRRRRSCSSTATRRSRSSWPLSVGYLYLVYIVFVIWSLVVVRRPHRGRAGGGADRSIAGSWPASPTRATTSPSFPPSFSASAT